MKQTNILLYPCNVVGYIRLAMLVIAVAMVGFYNYAGWQIGWELRLGIGVWLFFCLLILDLIDGYLARKLGHVTKFGALFELTLDLYRLHIVNVNDLYLLVAADRSSSETEKVRITQAASMIKKIYDERYNLKPDTKAREDSYVPSFG